MGDCPLTSKTILLLTTKFGRISSDRYLTNELADAFAAANVTVLVVVLDWDSPPDCQEERMTLPNGVEVLRMPAPAIQGLGVFVRNATRWLAASWRAIPAARNAFGNRQIDLVIAWSPLIVSAGLIAWATGRFRGRSVAYITDFFPLHQRAAGQIPGGAFVTVGKAIETWLMRQFDAVACMSPKGVEYLRNHYRLRAEQRTPVLPLWGDISLPDMQGRAETRRMLELSGEGPIVIFGGQISEGRGIEDILRAAALARQDRPDVTFVFLGKGRLEPVVREHIANGGDNVALRQQIQRDRYVALLSGCDVGLVVTLAETGVPTFPSKTIDYLRAGLPIVAAVEASTDYSDFVRENGLGVTAPAGDPRALLAAIAAILDDPTARPRMQEAARRALLECFDPRKAADRVLSM